MATISVVIPARNDAALLADALAALSRQTRQPDEVIVVDNASIDATAAVASSAGARVITQSVPGIWPAAAMGYDAASGDIIARLDADSVPPEDWLARVERAFDDDAVHAVTGPGRFYDCNRALALLGEALYIGGYFAAMRGWLLHPPVFGSNFAMARDVWRSVRDHVHSGHTDIHDDMDLSIHLGAGSVVRYDRGLRVGISARPLLSWTGFRRRVSWGLHTVALHYRDDSPWRRRVERRRRGAVAERPDARAVWPAR